MNQLARSSNKPSDDSISTIVGGLLDDTHKLVGQEVRLIRAEILSDMKALRWKLTAGCALFLAIAQLSIGIIFYSYEVMKWPFWASFGSMGVLTLILALMFISYGRKKNRPPVKQPFGRVE
jgi:hypothetical protein